MILALVVTSLPPPDLVCRPGADPGSSAAALYLLPGYPQTAAVLVRPLAGPGRPDGRAGPAGSGWAIRLAQAAQDIVTLAEAEGLTAHAAAVKLRVPELFKE